MAGIDPIWWDIDGGFHKVDAATKRALLAAMRLPAATRDDLGDSLARLAAERNAPLPAVATVQEHEAVPIVLGTQAPPGSPCCGRTAARSASAPSTATFACRRNRSAGTACCGENDPNRVCHLTVAPTGCYLPASLLANERRFGIAAHLYALRSRGDQGIGDFTTLKRFAAEARRAGAAVVGLNPLHALFPHDRSRASPYHPSDRRFLDPIYIDVSALPGGAGLPSSPGPVDYAAVWERKRGVLRAAYSPPDHVPDALRRFATFEAIAEALGSSDWQAWPKALRHPDSASVAAFATEHRDTVLFHAYLQVLAERQLAAAADNGLSIGLYRDLAVGAAPDGAEAWSPRIP